MWLPNGTHIKAKHVEQLVSSHFGDLREFINLCNSLAWAQQSRTAGSVPSFTERYNVADGGIDAEWMAFDVPEHTANSAPLLIKGWNVFQYKQRDINAAGRKEAFRSLKKDVSIALKNLSGSTKKRPDGYVLFTNLDLTGEQEFKDKKGRKTVPQKKQLRDAILKDADSADEAKVEIVGAAELAGMLNNLPHLRSAYFCRSDFITWDKACAEHLEASVLDKRIEFIGHDHEIQSLQWALENPEVRVILVSGASDVGKTRLVLEATANQSMDTVVARNTHSVIPGSLEALLSDHHMTIAFVSGYDPSRSEDIITYAIAQKNLKLIVEVAAPENLVSPGFGLDRRIEPIAVPPLPHSDASDLLMIAGAKFASGVKGWVLDQASGNPELLLQAAARSSAIEKSEAGLVEIIAWAYKRSLIRDFGHETLQFLRVLSFFDPIPLDRERREDLQLLARNLRIPEERVIAIEDFIAILKDRGLIRGGQSFGLVEPAMLSNKLAMEAVSQAGETFSASFPRLSPDSQLSVLRRLRQLQGPEVDAFFEKLFDAQGPFASVDFSVGRLEMLLTLSGRVPAKVAEELRTKLERLEPENRAQTVEHVRLQLF
ncbi:hypothetical protein ACFL2Q_08575 [Thermodesulfobacteriota bacterium]